MQKVQLAVNSGSTSLKVLMSNKNVSAKWDKAFSKITFNVNGEKNVIKVREDLESSTAFEEVITHFQKEGFINSLEEIDKIGYRVVNGGDVFTKPTRVDDNVLKKLKGIDYLSVNHNPIARATVEKGVQILPNAIHVLCFDTTFHATMPQYANMYGIDLKYYDAGIRKFGFHGISVEYIAKKSAEILEKEPSEFSGIICHLGGGCSITAIENGKSVDTTMGYTPVDGLVMSTRSGSTDPTIVKAIMDYENCDINEAINILSTKSGFAGIAGEFDYLKVESKSMLNSEEGEKAKLALKLFNYQIQKYIGGFMAILDNVDAIVFTGGIGENDPGLVCRLLDTPAFKRSGIFIGKESYKKGFLTEKNSPISVLQVPTNEEVAILETLKKL